MRQSGWILGGPATHQRNLQGVLHLVPALRGPLETGQPERLRVRPCPHRDRRADGGKAMPERRPLDRPTRGLLGLRLVDEALLRSLAATLVDAGFKQRAEAVAMSQDGFLEETGLRWMELALTRPAIAADRPTAEWWVVESHREATPGQPAGCGTHRARTGASGHVAWGGRRGPAHPVATSRADEPGWTPGRELVRESRTRERAAG